MQPCVAVFLWHHFGITQKKPAELAHCRRMAAMAGLRQASSTDCALHLTGQWQIVGQVRQLRVAWWFVAESEFFLCPSDLQDCPTNPPWDGCT